MRVTRGGDDEATRAQGEEKKKRCRRRAFPWDHNMRERRGRSADREPLGDRERSVLIDRWAQKAINVSCQMR